MRILPDRGNEKVPATDSDLIVNKLISGVVRALLQNHHPKPSTGEFVSERTSSGPTTDDANITGV
jgi:hypothetical protein